jgi:hypothetical protein
MLNRSEEWRGELTGGWSGSGIEDHGDGIGGVESDRVCWSKVHTEPREVCILFELKILTIVLPKYHSGIELVS